jgi:glycosyltransferase involved in cell wall biosynthesis
MKVLHILDELKHSGAEVMLQSAYDRMSRSGIDSSILSTGNEVGDYAAVLQQTGYRIHHIPFRKSLGFFIDLSALLKREKFSAVHIHTERAFIWYVLLAKLAGVLTVIRTFHGVFLFSSYLRCKRQFQRKISSKLCHAVHVAISDSILEVEKKRFHNECILIRNWTDVERFRPPSKVERTEARRLYDLEPDDFSIVTVGACTPNKNHIAIFSVMKKAIGLLDGRRLILLHIGIGPSLKDEELYTSRNGIKQYCRFLGTLNDVRPCLYAADAFVMTSQCEGLGLAAMEAMSTGVPVILYNVYGLRDLLQNGRGGMLVDQNDECLVDALLLMIRNPKLREVKTQEAREVILSTYSLEDSVAKYIHLYSTGHYK